MEIASSAALPTVARTPASKSESRHLADLIAVCAVNSLMQELSTWPKPGLISHVDSGSHNDMNAATLQVSAEAIRPFFAELALAGQEYAGMSRLRSIGVRAESAMMNATGGINTHRGAIFGLGLLCAAAGLVAEKTESGRVCSPARLGSVGGQQWGEEIRQGPIPLFSHGSSVLRRHGAGGARAEAASGFPSVYEVGLPALREARLIAPYDAEATRIHTCFALISRVEDTNLLHRGGAEGARYAAEAAANFLSNGGIGASGWRNAAAAVHAGFVSRRLSPGGCADLLAMTLFVDSLEV